MMSSFKKFRYLLCEIWLQVIASTAYLNHCLSFYKQISVDDTIINIVMQLRKIQRRHGENLLNWFFLHGEEHQFII